MSTVDHPQADGACDLKALYEESQARSTSRIGASLYASFNSSSSIITHRSKNAATSVNNRLGSAQSKPAPSEQPEYHSSGLARTSPTLANLLPDFRSRHHVSPSGNPLLKVRIPEDEAVLDVEDIKMMAGQEGIDSSQGTGGIRHNLTATRAAELNKRSSGGTHALSSSRSIFGDDNSKQSANESKSIGKEPFYPQQEATDIEKAKKRIKDVVTSPPFRRAIFVAIASVLFAFGLFLTLERNIHVKSESDWVEPLNNAMLLAGGDDWAFGKDAPKPIVGANVPKYLDDNIADWASETSRVNSAASMDGFGSIALSTAAKFRDVPLFWGSVLTGGSILENIFGQCLKLVQAAEKGVSDGHGEDLHLGVVLFMGMNYVNVDTTTEAGIEKARIKALVPSGMADVIHSPLLHQISSLFSPASKGRLFIVVRHPVEREFARFRRLKRMSATSNPGMNDEFINMSYNDFAVSDYVKNNWMTRNLVHKSSDAGLTAQDMLTAKEILRRKAIVGLHDEIFSSTRHFSRYFGWDNAANGGRLGAAVLSCMEKTTTEGLKDDKVGGEELDPSYAQEGSDAWKKIMEINKFDFELYIYSKALYKYQKNLG